MTFEEMVMGTFVILIAAFVAAGIMSAAGSRQRAAKLPVFVRKIRRREP
jgi:hypothetical protein